MIKAGILGATGYMGGEVLRIILEHPGVELAWATSRSGGDIALSQPNLYESGVSLIRPVETAPCDVVFLTVPTAESIEAAAKFLAQGCKVIDLGAALRLKDRETWEKTYHLGMPTGNWPKKPYAE